MKMVYKATIAEMRKSLLDWMGLGTSEDSAVKITNAYTAIHRFECIGPHPDGVSMMFMEEDGDPVPKSGVLMIIAGEGFVEDINLATPNFTDVDLKTPTYEPEPKVEAKACRGCKPKMPKPKVKKTKPCKGCKPKISKPRRTRKRIFGFL